VDVIIQYKVPPTSKHSDKVAKKGGKVKSVLGAAQAVVYSVAASELDSLADDPDVKYVSLDRAVAANDVYTNDASNATAAQSAGWSGTGIGVAVIDSGVSLPPRSS
jgi:serine protease AprX